MMEDLAYLLTDLASTLPDPGRHGKTRIIIGVHKTDLQDEDLLQLFSDILLDVEKEQTFDTLYKRLPFRWSDKKPYDTINPFGDFRQTQYRSLWTFDTQKDVLRHTNRNQRGQMPLSLLRNGIVSMADMEPLGGPVPMPLVVGNSLDTEKALWKPRVEIDKRLRTFLHRLLRDFDYQWRHVLRSEFNHTTLRVFAKAITRLSTLDFTIKENTGGHGPQGAYVWITQLPSWEPMEADVTRCGNFYLVLCQNIQEGLSIAKQHLLSQNRSPSESLDGTDEPANYMILSVKHIMLCRANSPTSLKQTAAEPLFNGNYHNDSPSDVALDYLIWATASARPLIATPLRSLPVEVQDMVLQYTSIGTVEAARLGCLLGLGTPFSWRDGSLKVTLAERYTIRPSGSPVESQICFDEHKGGVVYRARRA